MAAWLAFTIMGAVLGALLAMAGALVGARAGGRDGADGPLVEAVNARLPQVQCGQCGYPGCLPYARAIASERAAINQCPPGGDELVHELASLLGEAVRPVDPAFGRPAPPAVARIDEAVCIGCAVCLEVCPVDAIIGAPQQMHTVVARDCTGCDLCVPACPVDCIALLPAPWGSSADVAGRA